MLALICSSCLGSFMREGYENENDDNNNNDNNNNNNPNVDNDNVNLDPEDPSKMTNTRYSNYDNMYNTLDRETIAYSNSKLSRNKKIGPHKSKDDDNNYNNDDDNDDNNINSYGNVNKYPNVENDNILMAGKKGKHNKGGGGGYGNGNGNGSSIPGSQIPQGSEDLYMLKSEIVPPVCPACPAVTTCPSTKEKCPPCPPCARCPEPAFECKKVPNYSGQNDSYLPQPVMSDFSQFGL